MRYKEIASKDTLHLLCTKCSSCIDYSFTQVRFVGQCKKRGGRGARGATSLVVPTLAPAHSVVAAIEYLRTRWPEVGAASSNAQVGK